VNLPKFFAELKRRHVYRAAVAYGMAAWLLTQVATQVFPFFDIPNSAVRFVIVVLVIGFPIAMLLAGSTNSQAQDLFGTKMSIQVSEKARGVSSILQLSCSSAANWSAALWPASVPELEREPIPEKSIAVLPFANFSDDKQNAFFRRRHPGRHSDESG